MSDDERILNREEIYDGKVIDVARETVELPDRSQVELEMVRHPGGAATVALDEQDRVCMLRQYRHAAQGWLWELPAGRIEPNESPETTAARELAEEAGLVAAEWIDLGSMHSSPGIFTEVIHLWMARGLTSQPTAHEKGEVIEVGWLPFRQALDWAHDGTITDAKTLIGLYRADAYIKGTLELLLEDPGC